MRTIAPICLMALLLPATLLGQEKEKCKEKKARLKKECENCTPRAATDGAVIIALDLTDTCKAPDLACVERMERGDFYRVRVTGVNLGLYKVGINGRDTSAGKGYELPSFGSFALDAIKGITGNVGALSALAPAALQAAEPAVNSFLNNQQEEITAIVQNEDSSWTDGVVSKSYFVDSKTRQFTFNKGQVPFMQVWERSLESGSFNPTVVDAAKVQRASIIEHLKENALKTKYHADTLAWYKGKLDSLKMSITKYVLRTRVADKNSALIGQLKDNTFDLGKAALRAQELRDSLIMKQGRVKIDAEIHATFSEKNRKAIDADDTFKAKDKEITGAYSGLAKTADEAVASVSAEKMSELLQSVVNASNTDRWSYTSMPIQYMGGDATVKINVDAHDPKTGLPGYSTELRFPVQKPAYGGLTTSFYVGGLYDEAYSVKKTTTAPTPPDTVATTTYSLVEENPGKVEFGAAAFLTLGGKCKDERWGYQFVVGPGISIADKVKPRLLMGGGFSYGKKHMLLVNVGGIGGYVQRQANVYKDATTFPEKPEGVTVAQLKASLFASLGYMFKF